MRRLVIALHNLPPFFRCQVIGLRSILLVLQLFYDVLVEFRFSGTRDRKYGKSEFIFDGIGLNSGSGNSKIGLFGRKSQCLRYCSMIGSDEWHDLETFWRVLLSFLEYWSIIARAGRFVHE